MDRAVLEPFGAIPARLATTFGRTLQGPAVNDHSARRGGSALAKPDERTLVGDELGVDPPPGSLVNGMPRREIVGHIPPLEPVEQLPKGVLALGACAHQRQLGDEEGPFAIEDISRGEVQRGVLYTIWIHPPHQKCIAGSSRT